VKQLVIEWVAAPAARTTPGYGATDYWMHLLVALWALSVAIGMGRTVISVWRVRGMQCRFQTLSDPGAIDLIQRLAARLGYTGSFSVRAGEEIAAPLLTGFVKPVLLLPLALTNQLTLEETETVLLHELAHLRRYDQWFNLLQCAVEVVFYYHPAVHWISARVRQEREYCCDDLVLAHGPGGLPYARALLHYGERSSGGLRTVLSLTDGGGLLHRVQRFLLNQPIRYTMKRTLFLLPLFAGLTLIATAVATPKIASIPLASPNPLAPAPPPIPSIVDTLPDGDHEVVKIANGKTSRVKVQDGKIKDLVIEDEEIPASEYDAYEEIAEAMLDDNPRRSRRRLRDEWNFNYSADSLLRLSRRALERINTDSLHRKLRLSEVLLDSATDRLHAFHFDREGMHRMRVDMDSLETVMHISMDSLLHGFEMPRMEIFNSRPRSMEELEREERRLKEALEQLERRRQELQDNRSGYILQPRFLPLRGGWVKGPSRIAPGGQSELDPGNKL
jgi:hypothetical protein